MRKWLAAALWILFGGGFVFFQGYHLARTRWMRHWMDQRPE